MWRLFTDTGLMGIPDLSSFSVCSGKHVPSISPRPSAPFLPLVLSRILSEHQLGPFYRLPQLLHLSGLWNGPRTSFQTIYRTPKAKAEKIIRKHKISLRLTDLWPDGYVSTTDCLIGSPSFTCEVILPSLFTSPPTLTPWAVNVTAQGDQEDGAEQGPHQGPHLIHAWLWRSRCQGSKRDLRKTEKIRQKYSWSGHTSSWNSESGILEVRSKRICKS